MITTSNDTIFKKINILRSQGMSISANRREKKGLWKYDILDLGYNYRLDEIRSSLGISQFRRVEQINKNRIKIAKKYDKLIKNIKGISIPKKKEDRNHIYHLYSIKIGKDYPLTRNKVIQKLHRYGIGTSVQYYPLHVMSYYKNKYRKKIKQFPNSNILKEEILSLPIFPQMTEKQIRYVVSKLKV